MRANPSPMSVADYCQAIKANKIIVNKEYQRNVGVWTAQARSYFIESILLEFPIPKLYVYAKLDLKSRQQVKEIVDGQQRSQALLLFYDNRQTLTKNVDTPELRSLKYSQLDEDWQSKFLSYSLPIDEFSSATEEEVQEAFRRMNANNVPLNDEEQRNARFQGPFKWFIVQVADEHKGALRAIGLFSSREIIRMADQKAFAEIVLALDSGFSTVKGQHIDALYKKYNSTFPHEDAYGVLLAEGVEEFLRSDELHSSSFLKPFAFQSALLALLTHRHQGLQEKLVPADHDQELEGILAANHPLSSLEAALRSPDDFPALESFVKACTGSTNTEKSKRSRYMYFLAATR